MRRAADAIVGRQRAIEWARLHHGGGGERWA
jgi:hypothetical protein